MAQAGVYTASVYAADGAASGTEFLINTVTVMTNNPILRSPALLMAVLL